MSGEDEAPAPGNEPITIRVRDQVRVCKDDAVLTGRRLRRNLL